MSSAYAPDSTAHGVLHICVRLPDEIMKESTLELSYNDAIDDGPRNNSEDALGGQPESAHIV